MTGHRAMDESIRGKRPRGNVLKLVMICDIVLVRENVCICDQAVTY